MAFTFKVEVKPDYLLMLFEGAFESSDIEDFLTRVIETCTTHQCAKMLVDFREVKGSMSTMDRFNLGFKAAAKYLKAKMTGKITNCRFAFLGQTPLVDPNRFGETVAVNRGVNVKAFTELEEALRWLTVEKSS